MDEAIAVDARPWWLAENGLRVLRRRYFQKDKEGNFIESIDGLLRRVCLNQAHIDALWKVHKHVNSLLLNMKAPHDMEDEVIHALKDTAKQKKLGWDEETRKTYRRALQKSYDQYHEAIDAGYFMPSTPILLNSGARTGMLYSCFVIPMDDCLMWKPGDSEDICGIFDCVKAVVAVQKSGGGTGVSVSRTRPRDDDIHGGDENRDKGIVTGHTTGSINWLEAVSDGVKHIEQGSARNGANMGILRIDHPDIIEFCTVKDGKRLRNFNISVGMTDAFLKQLTEDPDSPWMVINPRTRKREQCFDKLGRMRPKDKAWSVQKVWDLIVNRAWEVGDPGLFFLDRVNRCNPTPNLGEIEAPNPCQPSWATVLTRKGINTIGGVAVDDEIWTGKHWAKISKLWSTGKKKVYAYYTRAGVFYGTENHRIVQNGEKVEIGLAEAIDTAQGELPWPGEDNAPAMKFHEPRIMDGLVFGDGMVHKASGNLVVLLVGKDDQDYFDSEIVSLFNDNRPGIKEGAWEVHTSITPEELPKTYERKIPERFVCGSEAIKCSFLRGLYSANGSVVKNRVTLKASSFKVIEQVQVMLSSLGIRSYYTVNKAHDVEFANGTYTCRESYDLNISTDRKIFARLIGFIQKDKVERLEQTGETRPNLAKTTYEIVETAFISEEEVFDLTVDDPDHMYWTGGLLVSNCGEQPLLPNESCNLGSMILSRFVRDGSIDWDLLAAKTRTAVRFHDAVIDANKYPVEVIAIRKATKATRKIGIGVMGWWDTLFKLGIPYESEEAVQLAERVMEFINSAVREESLQLAKERGPFPAWDGSRIQRDGKNKLRNATGTTIAPTGTISIIAGVTGGIEPTFGLAYLRTAPGIGTDVEEVNPMFREWLNNQSASSRFSQGDVRGILDHAFQGKSVAEHPLLTDEERDLFRTANEIDAEWHVRHQAAFQKHTDNAVSKTVNLPNDATVNDIDHAYRMAIEYGLKGITVFRDGCLIKTGQSQPMSHKKAEPEVTRDYPPKPATIRPLRPQVGLSMKSLFGMVHLHITVDPKTDRELEVFGCVGKAGELKLAHMEGMGRLISQILRLGGTMALVVSQLKGIGSKHTTLSNGGRHLSLEDTVGHMLAKYLEAKERWGMERLVLGDIGEDELRAFWTAPLEEKTAALDAWLAAAPEKKQASKSNLHGIVCASCEMSIVIVGGCAVCPGCGDGNC